MCDFAIREMDPCRVVWRDVFVRFVLNSVPFMKFLMISTAVLCLDYCIFS